MDKILANIVSGVINVMKGPILFLLMVCIVVSLTRHPPSRLAVFDHRHDHHAPH